jgi:hypothetical protein
MAQLAIASAANRGTSNLRPGLDGHRQPTIVGRLDQIVGPLESGRIRLVKIDIEGFEHKAILGMGCLLDRTDYLICEIDPRFLKQCGSSANSLFRVMQERGFRSFCAQPNSDGKWEEGTPDFKIQVENSQHFDVLFCREIDVSLAPLIAVQV